MKITLRQLRKIIREEVSRGIMLEYGSYMLRKGKSLYFVDDNGNEEYYGPAEGDHKYGKLKDGERVPAEHGMSFGGNYSGW
jgi:hypothetical protein